MARDNIVSFRQGRRRQAQPQGANFRPYRGRRRGRRPGVWQNLIVLLIVGIGTLAFDPKVPSLSALLSTFGPIEIGPFHLGETRAEAPGDVWADIHHVYDGDTFTIISPTGGSGQRVRIIGIDTAELGGARCEAERTLAEEQRDYLTTLIGGRVRLRVTGTDRYGRLLAHVYTEGGDDVARRMIAEAGARRYGGGWRTGWCG